jgi:predicted  nucleic acid-binding Zn-ribbon protein
LFEKRIKEYNNDVKIKKKLVEEAKSVVEGRIVDLKSKQEELEGIDRETAKIVEDLTKESELAAEKIDSRLLTAYRRIRGNARNGLAVVTVKRDACGGCYNRIPPQRQFDIRMSKKIIVCEYCGRILVSDLLDSEE